MKRFIRLFIFSLAVLATAIPLAAAAAQTPTPPYTLHSKRLFGYGGFSGDVRGTFRFSVSGSTNGPADTISSVTYQIDGQPMATVSQSPYSLDFQTTSYPSGWHQFTALVATRDGRQVTTPAIALNFISANQQGSSMGKILVPLFGGIAAIFLVMMGVQVLILRRNPGRLAPGAERHYGLKGGAICPRCGRPFAIHFWSLNLLGNVLDRCDYCGRVGIFRRRSMADLRAAEVAEVAGVQASETALPGAIEETEEERLRKLLDESKYTK